MKKYLLILFVFASSISFSQKQYSVSTGYGFYEGYFVGADVNLSVKYKLGTSLGLDQLFSSDEKYFATGVVLHRDFFTKESSSKWIWFVNAKFLYWDFSDAYYHWQCGTISASVGRTYSFNKNFSLSAEVGPAYSFVFKTSRKNMDELGNPYHNMPDFKIQLTYKISNEE